MPQLVRWSLVSRTMSRSRYAHTGSSTSNRRSGCQRDARIRWEVVLHPHLFIVIGFLIDPLGFVHSVVDHFPIVAAILIALIAGKWIAAAASGRAFSYSTATGQTTCWDDNNGNVIRCAGIGHDGDTRRGAPLTYVDNGDGTITDANTGSCRAR